MSPGASFRTLPRLVVAGALAATLVLSACGSEDRPTPQAAVHGAPAATAASGPAEVAVAVALDLAGEGTHDVAAGRVELVLHPTHAAAASGGGPYRVSIDGDTATVVLGQDPPIQGTLGEVAEAVRDRVPSLANLLSHPGGSFDLSWLASATDFNPFGGQQARGVETYRYTVRGELGGPGRAEADVWIDDDGRVRRLQFAADPSILTTTTVRGKLFEFVVIDWLEFEGDGS